MPQYVYECPKCKYEESKIVRKYNDTIHCSNCGFKHSNKIPSLSSFVLKKGGVGWAKDGYSK